ncbi:hypothetical protein [Streptomyces sp. NPDC096153]|uniref:hypothetical protein n=1 Tax=Streptomyces sp. NPDC096153 TaxID=3155548 RepID=UPI003316810D
MKRYAYRIHRTDNARTLSSGVQQTEQTPTELTAALLDRNRAEHSYYDGPRRCWVWEHAADAPLPRTPPADAESYDG